MIQRTREHGSMDQRTWYEEPDNMEQRTTENGSMDQIIWYKGPENMARLIR